MPSLRENATEYWRMSQHMAALQTPQEREQFALLVVVPMRDRAYDPRQRDLLTKVISRA